MVECVCDSRAADSPRLKAASNSGPPDLGEKQRSVDAGWSRSEQSPSTRWFRRGALSRSGSEPRSDDAHPTQRRGSAEDPRDRSHREPASAGASARRWRRGRLRPWRHRRPLASPRPTRAAVAGRSGAESGSGTKDAASQRRNSGRDAEICTPDPLNPITGRGEGEKRRRAGDPALRCENRCSYCLTGTTVVGSLDPLSSTDP